VRRLLAEPAVVSAPEPAPAPVEEAMDIPPLDHNVGYAVQIAAYRHASELNPGWAMLKEKYKDLIGGLEPRRSEVDFGNRDSNPKGFFYRLNAGPLNSYKAAKAICDAISAQGGDCWVRPPLPTEGRVPAAVAKPQQDGALASRTATAQAAAPASEDEVWVAIDSPEAAGESQAQAPHTDQMDEPDGALAADMTTE
jgi:hypothetical protein